MIFVSEYVGSKLRPCGKIIHEWQGTLLSEIVVAYWENGRIVENYRGQSTPVPNADSIPKK
jgi:hypothetical protein